MKRSTEKLHNLLTSFLFFCRITGGIQINNKMNSCFLKHWILVILLLWSFLKVTENFQARRTEKSASSTGRAKRGWVWNQFVVPEEMDTRQHVGRVLIFWKIYSRWFYKDVVWMSLMTSIYLRKPVENIKHNNNYQLNLQQSLNTWRSNSRF